MFGKNRARHAFRLLQPCVEGGACTTAISNIKLLAEVRQQLETFFAQCKQFRLHGSEIEFQSTLQDAWRSGADSLAKGRASDIAVNRVGTAELRMVEEVEGLNAKQKRL